MVNIGEKVLKFLKTTESRNKDLFTYICKIQEKLVEPKLRSLSKIQRTLGSEKNMLHKESLTLFDKRVDTISKKFKKGAKPFPLLAELHQGTYYLLDGNHTLEALKKVGRKKYWIIFYEGDEIAQLFKNQNHYEKIQQKEPAITGTMGCRLCRKSAPIF